MRCLVSYLSKGVRQNQDPSQWTQPVRCECRWGSNDDQALDDKQVSEQASNHVGLIAPKSHVEMSLSRYQHANGCNLFWRIVNIFFLIFTLF